MSRTASQREPHPFPAGNREGAILYFQLEIGIVLSRGARKSGFRKL